MKRSMWWQGHGVPDGAGRPVLLIAGFLAGSSTLDALHHVLNQANWDVVRAPVGRNAGPAYVGIDTSAASLHELSERHVEMRGTVTAVDPAVNQIDRRRTDRARHPGVCGFAVE